MEIIVFWALKIYYNFFTIVKKVSEDTLQEKIEKR